MEVSLSWEPHARCHSACSGVAPLSLVVGVSGKEQPRQQGYAGMAVVVKWMAASAWNGPLFPSWVIAMDLYVIITLCYALWLSCCAARWGLQRDEATSADLDHRLKKTKQNKGKSKLSNVYQIFGWAGGKKNLHLHLKGYRANFQAAES